MSSVRILISPDFILNLWISSYGLLAFSSNAKHFYLYMINHSIKKKASLEFN